MNELRTRLDEWRQNPEHRDEDGYVSPSLAAIAAAENLLPFWGNPERVRMLQRAGGGIAFQNFTADEALSWSIAIDIDGNTTIRLWDKTGIVGTCLLPHPP